jgi:Flp pilus assembly protein TadG
MRIARALIFDTRAAAAAEMALVTPFLLALMFGAFELGNLFLDEHALEKQVRDGARFAARLELSDDYSCSTDPSTVFKLGDEAADDIIKVTKDGVTSGDGNPRWTSYWDRQCNNSTPTLAVTVRCVNKADIDTDDTGSTGIYSGLDGQIPVVRVAGAVKYRSVLAAIGLDATNVCLRAESEAAVQGL